MLDVCGNTLNLEEILADHTLWLAGNGGKRADLRRANLQGADFREADLRRANLPGADLRRANLQGADFREADLQGAVGFKMLPVGDYRGHSFTHAILCADGWRIRAGCRDLSIEEAKTHWGVGNKHTPEDLKEQYLAAITWLEGQIAYE